MRRVLLAVSIACSTAAVGQNAIQGSAGDGAAEQFRAMTVDAGAVTGKIRSFQGVNGPPYPVEEGLPSLVKQYRDLKVNTVRTHDSYGATEADAVYTDKSVHFLFWDDAERKRVVEASRANTIFKDWNADPNDPASYNFGPTDKIVQAIRASGAEVYYRVGRSAGGNLEPPKDFEKYAAVTGHIAMHYNQGWDRGMHAGIRYWEIWNEPQFFWSGTPEQFYELYDKVSRALRAIGPELKIGTNANAMPLNDGAYRETMLDYIKAHNLPFDFYSWHTYADMSFDPYDAVRIAAETRRVLDGKGFTKTESILSEWNLSADFTPDEEPQLSSIENAAFIGSVMMYLQDAKVDMAHLYRGDSLWMGLFNRNGSYRKTAYAFKAMGQMQETPERVKTEGGDTQGFNLLAGRSRDGKRVQILVCNYEIPVQFTPPIFTMMQRLKAKGIEMDFGSGFDVSSIKSLAKRTGITYSDNKGFRLAVKNLPWGAKGTTMRRYRVTREENLTLVEEKWISGAAIEVTSALSAPGLELIDLEAR